MIGERSGRANRQGGFALLLTLLVLVIGATSVYISIRRPIEAGLSTEAQSNSRALARARDAVIARAATDRNRPGSLSCPDLDRNGSAGEGSPPDCTAFLGRFPHQTHAIKTLRDAAGERIWYAIADGVLDQGLVTVNPEEVDPIEVNGRPGHAAVVIAPGGIVEGQDRGSGNRNDEDQYLENLEGTYANNAGPPYEDCGDRAGCNDRVRGVTVATVFEIPQRRVLAAVSEMLQIFYDEHGYLPFAAPFGPDDECEGATTGERTVGQLPFEDAVSDCGPVLDRGDDPTDGQWLNANEWFRFVVYRVDADCAGTGATCGAGGLTLGDKAGFQAIIAVAGRPLFPPAPPAHSPDYSQDRSDAASIDDYLDSVENTNGGTADDINGTRFDDAPPRRDDNDSLRGLVVNE